MSAVWQKNQVTAAKRRCDLLVMKSDNTLAPRGTDFIALGYVFICGVNAPNYDLAVGTLTNKRRPLVVADDTVESADTGADTLTLTAHSYETGDGPFVADEAMGALAAGTQFWIINVDDDTIQVAASLADAYAGTEVALTGTETGAIISDTATTQRGLDGHFTYQATRAETNHDAPETTVIVDGTNYERSSAYGAFTTVNMQAEGDAVLSHVLESGVTVEQALRLLLRGEAAPFVEDPVTGVITHRDLNDTKDSHKGTITTNGRSATSIIDAD